MLSIIISTKREERFNAVKKNIEVTIGAIRYEIIKIYNPGKLSLSEAYNAGAALSKFKNLLFLHDDVQILTTDWGRILLSTLKIENCGIAGLAGGIKKFKLPTGHYTGIKKMNYISVVHNSNNKCESEKNTPLQVKTLDGVFLALKKERWEKYKFNPKIEGFHFYDIDISLRISEDYQNYIIPKILLYHFSKGNFDNSWIQASLKFHQQNYNFDNLTIVEIHQIRQFWYKRLLNENISTKNRIKFTRAMGVHFQCLKSAMKFLFASRKT